jgi:hypothetical protein
MQDQHLFEYAVIRVVPRVEREEFINVGVILYCKKKRYLQSQVAINEERLKALAPLLDISEVRDYLHALQRICRGEKGSGMIGTLDQPSRFRWLTATRSTVVQTSRIHPGFCTNLDATLDQLFVQYVL